MATLSIIKNDPWLEPYADAIEGRHQDAINKEKELIAADGSLKALPTPTTISDFTAPPPDGCSANGLLTQPA